MAFIKLKDVKKGLGDSLALEMNKRGFIRRASIDSFVRKFPGGLQVVHLCFIYHGIDVDVTLDFGVRFTEVEDLINKHRPDVDDKYKKESMTLNADLSNLCRKQIRWTITGMTDLGAAGKGILETIDTIILPDFEKHSSLQNCLHTVSGEGTYSIPYAVPDDWRAITAIAIAFVLGNKDQFTNLVKAKRDLLLARIEAGAKYSDFGLFEKLQSELTAKFK